MGLSRLTGLRTIALALTLVASLAARPASAEDNNAARAAFARECQASGGTYSEEWFFHEDGSAEVVYGCNYPGCHGWGCYEGCVDIDPDGSLSPDCVRDVQKAGASPVKPPHGAVAVPPAGTQQVQRRH